MYSLLSKILYRLKRAFNRFSDQFGQFAMYRVSRSEAHNVRKRLIKDRGRKVVNRKLKAKIKQYCYKTYGSSRYWPWLALYTEMRGEFLKGLIPDDVYRFEILPKLNPEKFASLSEAKSMDHKLFPGMTIEPQLVRLKGEYIDRNGNVLGENQAMDYLYSLDREVVIKPDNGRQGKGIMFVHSKDIDVDKLPSDADLIIQERVRQHNILTEVYPYSVNTFRILTYMENSGDVGVKFINLKFGVGGNMVDNISKGGIWVFVALNGKVSSSAYDEFGLETGEHHPDTGYRFSDLKLPFINDIISLCKKAHRSFPYVGLIGWDVYLNESEEPFIVEWNAKNPWFWDVEARFGPLWSKEEIGEIMGVGEV